MGRKAILKNLVDIVVMLKQDDDRAKKDQRNLERLRQLDELYGTNDAEEVEGLMGVRDAPDKVSQVRELGRIGELDSEEAKEVEGLMGVREGGKSSSSQQPPSDAGQGSRKYDGKFTDDDRESLKLGRTFNRVTGKRLIPEGTKIHPVTGKTVDFPTSGGPRNPDSPPPGRNLVDSIGQAGEKIVQQARSSQQQPQTSPSSGGQSDYPKSSELPKNAQGEVVGISADDPRWSAPRKTTPSPQPSIPTVSPIPTPTPSESSTPTPSATPTPTPTATPNAPPKVEAKHAKESPFSKAILKNLVDIVVMLKQDEEDKEKPEEEYKIEIPEGLRRKVQAILREKHKVKALAPDTGKWGGPTALSSNGHGRGSTGKSTIQNAFDGVEKIGEPTYGHRCPGPTCDKMLPDTINYCPHCGTSQTFSTISQTYPKKSTPDSTGDMATATPPSEPAAQTHIPEKPKSKLDEYGARSKIHDAAVAREATKNIPARFPPNI